MEKLLTVVIPTYNTERFLENCLDSLLGCSMAVKTEILVIDDGSKDRSGDIAESYAKQYPDIVKVVHKENGGHGSAINFGIIMATGHYFKVVDSDDTVDTKGYEHYLQQLEQLDCDLIATPFTCVWYHTDQDGNEIVAKEQKRTMEGAGKLKKSMVYSFAEAADRLHIRMHEWTIRTALLREHEIRMTEHSYYVDMQYILFPIPWIQTVCILSDYVYRYRLGAEEQSISTRNMQKNREQHRAILNSLVEFYREREQQNENETVLRYLARGIAKMEADEVQIALSLPISKTSKAELTAQEAELFRTCPTAYFENKKYSIWLLRWSKYLFYPIVAWLWKVLKG